MSFTKVEKKGLNSFLLDTNLAEDAFSIHISELEAGISSHAPHTHNGMEAYHVMSGELTVGQGNEKTVLHPNEAAAINANIPHGVTNTGNEKNRYMVIITKP